MNLHKITFKRKHFLFASIFTIGLALGFLLLSFFFPTFISSNYYQKSLTRLRQQSQSIKEEYTHVQKRHKDLIDSLSNLSFPQEQEQIYDFFRQLDLDQEHEGIGYYNFKGNPIIWLGNIIEFKDIFLSENGKILFPLADSSLVIEDKASVFLVSFVRVNETEMIALFRLLAFLPEIKASYFKDYHFLDQKYLKNCSINYWDFREDITGFERIFARHKDEYIGQPSLQDEIQTLFFPLRNEEQKIIATITLSSPSLSSSISSWKENLLLSSYISLGFSFIFILIFLVSAYSRGRDRFFPTGLIIIFILVGLRFLFFPLSGLEKIQSLPVFSPANAAYLSIWNMTKSPGDIFLSALFLCLILSTVLLYSKKNITAEPKHVSLIKFISLISPVFFLSFALIYIYQKILFNSVIHSNINLLRFTWNPLFLLVFLSILLFFISISVAIYAALRYCARIYPQKRSFPFIIFLVSSIIYILVLFKTIPIIILAAQSFVIFLIYILAFFPNSKRKTTALVGIFLLSFYMYFSLQHYSGTKNRSIIENSLQHIIKSQEDWGVFLLRQSFLEINKERNSIIPYFETTGSPDFSQYLWGKTLIAKHNWYSSLEIINPEGEILSRFSLNVPETHQLDLELPLSAGWNIFNENIIYMGNEKNFLIGYRDWFQNEEYVGRTIIYLSIDHDMLPFLYSATPYFELLRETSIPSLDQIAFGFAIFNQDGTLAFNPDKISYGISPQLLRQILTSKEALWSDFRDNTQLYSGLFFPHADKTYCLFLPKKKFINYAVEYMQVFLFNFFIISLLIAGISLFTNRIQIKNPFWSFSSRVNISFIMIALIPLLLFSFSTQRFFERIFNRQYAKAAETQAIFAQRVLEDFIFLQQEEQVSLTLPPDEVVMWISSTISNDVNLYQEGILISSSRREFFNYGLLPEIIDGEIYFKILYENHPFYTQTQKIGDYSFHTLTVPYFFEQSLLLISLPFAQEKPDIASAAGELLEFIFFISIIFIIVVIFFARFIGNMIVTPIQKLLAGTKKVSLGDLETRIDYNRKDEMKTLTDGFNTMVLNLKKHQHELAELSQKVASAEMAGKVAHEIKNPLTPIQLSVQHLLKVYEDDPAKFKDTLKESASYIIKEVENLRRIAQEFLETSKSSLLQKESIDLKALIQETIEPYKSLLSEKIEFDERYIGDKFVFQGDKTKMVIVLRNIITNAIESIKNSGKIKIHLEKKEGKLFLLIQDSGPGIDSEMLERIFEPYFSTKDAGTGLGLPIAKKIILDHQGTITAESQKNMGLSILITLPID